MGIFLLWATWAHEYMAIFSKFIGIARRGDLKELEVWILIKFGQYINVMMAVAVVNFKNF